MGAMRASRYPGVGSPDEGSVSSHNGDGPGLNGGASRRLKLLLLWIYVRGLWTNWRSG